MEVSPQPTLLQRVIGYVAFALALLWIVTSLAELGVEGAYGKSRFATLLSDIGHIEFAGFFLIVISALILRVTGVFRVPVRAAVASPYRMSGRGIALGVLITVIGSAAMVSVLLIFANNKVLTDTITNIGPMFLLIGVWLALMMGIWWDQRRKEKEVTTNSLTSGPPQ